MKKYIFWVLLIFALFFLVSGCGQKTEYVTSYVCPDGITVSDSSLCIIKQNEETNIIQEKPNLELEIVKVNYDSCRIRLEQSFSGIGIVEADSITELNYFNKRGGISSIYLKLKKGNLEDYNSFDLKANILDSSGRVVYQNQGTIATNRISKNTIFGDEICGDSCESIYSFISLPYQEGGTIELEISVKDSQVFKKTVPIEQQECLVKTISTLFNDLFECSETNKQSGEKCTCFDDRCISHEVVDEGYVINPDGSITLVEGDEINKDEIISYLNRRNFDFVFTQAGNDKEGFTCQESSLSATKQIPIYFLAIYHFKDSVFYQGNDYEIFCQSSPI